MNKFAIILGDPNSINSEILAKSSARKSNCFVIGSYDLIETQLKILKIKVKIEKINDIKKFKKSKKKLFILDVPLKFKKPFSVKSEEISKYIKKSFDIAHKLSVEKKIKGFINCPIDKKNLFKNKSFGVTEFLGHKNKTNHSEVMMIYNQKLSVVPITTHVKINNVPKLLKKKLILLKVKTLDKFYKRYFKIKPRIAILGLNPHNYELRKNSEEKKILLPAINKLKKKFKLLGPFPADTIFMKQNIKKFDVIVGMYHDQVLAPFKALFEFDAINITLGLPYIRLSPDHGTARNKIFLKNSNPNSLDKCIKIMSKLPG